MRKLYATHLAKFPEPCIASHISVLDNEEFEMSPPSALLSLPNISEAWTYSETQIAKFRQMLASQNLSSDLLIGTFGSFARSEASPQSDLDFVLVCRKPSQIAQSKKVLERVESKLFEIAGRSLSSTGAFGNVEDLETMLSNIGGNKDDNNKITRRVLFLLEGEWLHNKDLFGEIKLTLLNKYVRQSISAHQLALFLLNDIIRYYRTICVDFEIKKIEQDKPWGTRNIKLVFSRKLLYFSGVFAVAETYQRRPEEKIRILSELLGVPPIARLLSIAGTDAIYPLALYDNFLGQLNQDAVRQQLDQVKESDRTNPLFRDLKDNGHHFSLRLINLLKRTYDSGHPIYRALLL